MRKVFLSLALVAIIVSSTMLPEIRQKTAASFSQLQKSRVGKNIFTAIQLELSSSSQENIVSRIIVLLNELLTQTQQNLEDTQHHLETETKECEDTTKSMESQIEGKQAQITQGNQDLPILNLEKKSDEDNQTNQQAKHDQAVIDLNDANDTDSKAVANYAKATRNHNAMVNALQQARALIVTLQSTSFLQTNSNKILAQITAHTQSSLASLNAHPNREIYQVLMQMAQEVAVQADQQLVGSVIEIIDDLLKAEADALDSESTAEHERQTEYNHRVEGLNQDIEDSHGEVLRLQSEIVRLGNQIQELEDNLKTWNDQLTHLQETLEGHNTLCAQQIENFNSQIVDYTSEIDVIQQVITIFESQAIQDIKSVVDDLSYTEN